MVTVDQILAYCEREMAARHLSGDREGLRRIQLALALLAEAAEREADDKATALRFRSLAAKAANLREQIEGDEA
ncbi:MAG: hypothetical protein OHK0015_35570 [Chloroflexi bacterium OHK40]